MRAISPFDSSQKFQIGKRASEYGTTNSLHYYEKNFPDVLLKETSVRRFLKILKT